MAHIVYILLLFICYFINALFICPEIYVFIAINLLYSFYCLYVSFLLYRKRGVLGLSFLFVIKAFLLAYGFGFLWSYYLGSLEYYDGVILSDLILAMYMASWGLCCFFLFYNIFSLKPRVFYFYSLIRPFVNDSFEVHNRLLLGLFFLVFLAKTYFISLGVYGVSSTIMSDDIDDGLLGIVGFVETIHLGLLFTVSILYVNGKFDRWIYWFLFSIGLFFSVLSGFKFHIIFNFLIYTLVVFVFKNRVSVKTFFVIGLSLQVAYFVIGSYRLFIEDKEVSDVNSISKILSSMYESSHSSFSEEYDVNNDKLVGEDVLARVNFLPEMSLFINYKEKYGIVPGRDPDFAGRILSIPASILLPGALWDSKPKNDLGVKWVTNVVVGRDYNSSIAFGPLGYLYLLGGVLAVAFGMFFLAFVIAFFEFFYEARSMGSFLIYMGMLYVIVMRIEGSFDFYLIGIFRMFIMLFIYQFLLLRGSKINT